MYRLGPAAYLLSCVVAAGCTRTVTVTTTRYIPVPPSLTRPCLHEAAPETNLELLAAYEEARIVIADCDYRLAEIRGLAGKP